MPSIRLDVLVVTGAADERAARAAFRLVPRAYAPLGIALVPRFRVVRTVPNLDGDGFAYLAWLKRHVGGRRPAGTDLVYLATSRKVDGAGRADCIGGIATAEHAFAVGMLGVTGYLGVDVTGSPVPLPAPELEDGAAKLAAHEIGHLLGGQHHYGQCGTAADPGDPDHPCDVMLTVAQQQVSLRFGPVNAAVVRETVERYAASRTR